MFKKGEQDVLSALDQTNYENERVKILKAREVMKKITYRTFRTHKNPERELYAICASMYSHGRM